MDPMFNLPQAPAPIFGRTTSHYALRGSSDTENNMANIWKHVNKYPLRWRISQAAMASPALLTRYMHLLGHPATSCGLAHLGQSTHCAFLVSW